MSLDNALLTIQVLAALSMVTSLSLDWTGVLQLRRARTLTSAREGITTLERSTAFGTWARLTLAGGLWLAVDADHWTGWIIAGLVGWTALVLLGEPLTGKDLRPMAKIARKSDDLPTKLAAKIHDPRLWCSVHTRTGVVAAVLTDMLAKPGTVLAFALLAAGYLIGTLTARLTRSRQPEPGNPA
ncbi:hypothetical protein [Streptomyces rishiriensis]|uniref:hypothetical protein n=1 Tax=Streptomyces rishiriensis TaxID=68264 RepID=UPI000D59B0E1|nr:hypothetical protein [Streptomyces rishiriensis]